LNIDIGHQFQIVSEDLNLFVCRVAEKSADGNTVELLNEVTPTADERHSLFGAIHEANR
jgi:hypothetical protein